MAHKQKRKRKKEKKKQQPDVSDHENENDDEKKDELETPKGEENELMIKFVKALMDKDLKENPDWAIRFSYESFQHDKIPIVKILSPRSNIPGMKNYHIMEVEMKFKNLLNQNYFIVSAKFKRDYKRKGDDIEEVAEVIDIKISKGHPIKFDELKKVFNEVHTIYKQETQKAQNEDQKAQNEEQKVQNEEQSIKNEHYDFEAFRESFEQLLTSTMARKLKSIRNVEEKQWNKQILKFGCLEKLGVTTTRSFLPHKNAYKKGWDYQLEFIQMLEKQQRQDPDIYWKTGEPGYPYIDFGRESINPHDNNFIQYIKQEQSNDHEVLDYYDYIRYATKFERNAVIKELRSHLNGQYYVDELNQKSQKSEYPEKGKSNSAHSNVYSDKQNSNTNIMEYTERSDILYHQIFDVEMLIILVVLTCFIGFFCFFVGIVLGKIHAKRKKKYQPYQNPTNDDAEIC